MKARTALGALSSEIVDPVKQLATHSSNPFKPNLSLQTANMTPSVKNI